MKIYANEKFTETRIREGFSVPELAELVGVSKMALYHVEKNTNGVSPKLAKKIIEILEVDFDDIFKLVERNN